MNTKYPWRAQYLDGSTLSQFNSDGSENLFRDIDLSRLDVFIISSPLNPNAFQVNVKHGLIGINGQPIIFGDFSSNRLIYFRRQKKNLSMQTNWSGGTTHCFGLQATVNNQNKKIVFGVSEETGQVGLVL